jgi:hypothetical protein
MAISKDQADAAKKSTVEKPVLRGEPAKKKTVTDEDTPVVHNE